MIIVNQSNFNINANKMKFVYKFPIIWKNENSTYILIFKQMNK